MTPPRFRRRIDIRSRTDGGDSCVRAALEDDFHHFRVELAAREGRIAAVRATAARQPYTLCEGAAAELQQLVGMALSPIAHTVTRSVEARQHCTHQLELAGLACAAAARGLSTRRYDIEVPLREAGCTNALLWRDGTLLLSWSLQDDTIVEPPLYAGMGVRQAMAGWAMQTLSADEAEAALVLRRCAVISNGKGLPLDEQPHARVTGLCWAQQPVRAAQALRVVGSTWDFSTSPQRLCADDEAWLAFEADASV
ncbi:DUF2889 domain-containing protein [Azohydromonas lata]|jgi:hypothetical protein|uniref:DUF2889 domain-containing protein n=1 Tax=Azohydromonas lata TaxID=45677 RepID=UPI000833541D|nr:DUF2889 domain-containing protein [Azohydromonas lata]